MTKIVTIELESPIIRGDTEIKTLQLRKPKAGELRGLIVGQIVQGDAGAMLELLPRITMPPLTSPEVEELEADDFTALSNEVVGFFMTPAMRATAGLT
ncbi:MAG: phage tail assembly protein [Sphingomonas sp.]|nr:phage tail assembly protein [Sphingomonas sp.]